MKKTITIIALAFAVTLAFAGKPQKEKVSLDKLAAVISESREMDGLEVFQVGRIGTAALKGLAGLNIAAEGGDKDARAVKNLISGVKKMVILDYDECSESDKVKFSGRLDRVLTDDCLLMELKDDGQAMKIYSVCDEEKGKFDNFVMYAPADHALICLFGSIPMDALSSIVSE